MMDLSPEHQEMVERFEKLMAEHEESYHDIEAERIWYAGGFPTSVAKIVREHHEMKGDLKEIADVFLGTRRSDLAGGGRRHDGVADLAKSNAEAIRSMTQALNEMKRSRKVPTSVWVAIITTGGGVITSLLLVWAELQKLS